MAQWSRMTQLLQYLPHEVVNNLYPSTFPIEVRHFLADWIEQQIWEDFEPDNMEQEPHAKHQLDQVINMLQSMAQQNTSVVDKMKLMQISKTLSLFQPQPLNFGVLVRDILRNEKTVLNNSPQIAPTQYQQESSIPNIHVDRLVNKVLEVQDIRQKIHMLQEELNWDKQNYETLQGSISPSNQDAQNIQKLQICIQQKEYNMNTMAAERVQLLQECVDCLDKCQACLISKLKTWCFEQHKATIGHPFDENLNPLQARFEQLLEMNAKLRQELLLVGELNLGLQEKLSALLKVLVQSSIVVDKQPPQVIKTQSKFSTTVRYLLGEKCAPGKPVVLKAQIITELQARSLGQQGVPSDNVGELINNTAILEHNTATKSTCATFRNMSIKKIKRADRKGSESVTEEKFALLFSTEITITGCDAPYRIQVISVPLVVIVHGSQDINALATIIWDCAFSEPDRIPFIVPERVPWRMMCNTLNSKFTSEVKTHQNLDNYNLHFLAQKIFDKPDYMDDFSNMMVSWSQFNKEVLPGRSFTFWQWFEGVMELTKKHLHSYWSDKLIFGFIGKQHLHLILKDRPNGTFLLRFSDSEIGGITIAYVSASENGGQKVQNIQPFTKKDLEIRCLGDRIRDINYLTLLYPDIPKRVFKKYYTELQTPTSTGYIPVTLVTVPQPATDSSSAMVHQADDVNNTVSYHMDPASASPSMPIMGPYPGNSVFQMDPSSSPVVHNQGAYNIPFQQSFSPQNSMSDQIAPVDPDDFSTGLSSSASMELELGEFLNGL